jgi:hypothetical protein
MRKRVACTPWVREWKGTPARTILWEEAVQRKERRVPFGREKQKGKRNDPGKAQSINGCGAEVKHC